MDWDRFNGHHSASYPKISSMYSEPSPGLDAEPSHWLPSAMVLLGFISQIAQCLEQRCQATSQTASLRLGIPSHDIKGKADCLARLVHKQGSFSSPLSWLHIKSDKATSSRVASLPLSLTTWTPGKNGKAVVRVQKPCEYLWLSNGSNGETTSS